MFSHLAGSAAHARVRLRHVVFVDETIERGPTIVALERPSWLPWPQVQCVAKILLWLHHAADEAQYVGWTDSDTLLPPKRLVAHLTRVAHAVPRSQPLVWGGLWEHWERASWDLPSMPKTLGGVGFAYCSPCRALAEQESDPRMLRRSAAERRATSFGMTQGGWTYFSAAAARTLLGHVLQKNGSAFPFAAAGGGAPLPPVRPGTCTMPTDVAIGWLGAQAFEGLPLYAVDAHNLLEAYVYPIYGRFNPRHALAVHGLKRAGAKDWFVERMDNASYAPPNYVCNATPWAHARTREWQLCRNVAMCDESGVLLSPTRDELRNLSVPWLPVGVRGLCRERKVG